MSDSGGDGWALRSVCCAVCRCGRAAWGRTGGCGLFVVVVGVRCQCWAETGRCARGKAVSACTELHARVDKPCSFKCHRGSWCGTRVSVLLLQLLVRFKLFQNKVTLKRKLSCAVQSETTPCPAWAALTALRHCALRGPSPGVAPSHSHLENNTATRFLMQSQTPLVPSPTALSEL